MLQGEKRDTRDRLRQSHDDSQKNYTKRFSTVCKERFLCWLTNATHAEFGELSLIRMNHSIRACFSIGFRPLERHNMSRESHLENRR
jgi:hypothetical protein